MIKNTLCALTLSLVGMTACEERPVRLQPEGGQAIVIPAECYTVTNFSIERGNSTEVWELNCRDNEGKSLFFINYLTNKENSWKKYEFVREK